MEKDRLFVRSKNFDRFSTLRERDHLKGGELIFRPTWEIA